MAAIRRRGGWCMKVHGGPYQPAGIPDIVGCFRGHFFGIEDKKESNTATAIQVKTQRDIVRAGGVTTVAYSVDDAMAVLDAIEECL